MIVRINYMYEDDCDFEDFEEGERFSVSSDALTIGFQILGTPDDEEALDGREGELSSDFEYELHDGTLCAIVDGKFVPCEDDYDFQCRLDAIGYKP